MAIVDRHIDSRGLSPNVINKLAVLELGSYKAAATNNVFTKQTLSSTMNATSAAGTQVDFPRNLQYQMSLTGGTASSAGISGGTFVVDGLLMNGSTARETVALTALASLSTASQGVLNFAFVQTVSFSNFSLHTSYSANSNSISFSVGVGNKVGLPQSVRSSNAVPFAYIGTLVQTTTSATASTTNNQYTVRTGDFGTAGVSFSNALATNTPVLVYLLQTR